mgnify:CR=1 FL=1
MTDRIAYLLITQPGGVDGLDRDDKGGVIVAASFSKERIERRKGLDCRYRIEPRVVNEDDKRKALAKLDKLDRLLLGIDGGA